MQARQLVGDEMRWHPFFFAAVTLALAACNRASATSGERPTGQVTTPLPGEIFGTGVLAHERSVVVAFERAGVIHSLGADVGDRVSEGQLLATMDDADARADLLREQANRRSEQASLRRLRSDTEEVRIREEIALREANRSALLLKAGAIPEIEHDQSQDTPRLLAQGRRGLELQRGVQQARLSQAQAREAQAALWKSKTQLRALSAGRVVRRDATAGSYTAPGAPLLVIAPAGSEIASLWVHESELPHLRSGAPVEMTLRDREHSQLRGSVLRIHPEADQRTHEVRVDVRIENPPEPLVFGVRIDGKIHRGSGGAP